MNSPTIERLFLLLLFFATLLLGCKSEMNYTKGSPSMPSAHLGVHPSTQKNDALIVQTAATRHFDLLHTTLEVSIDWENQQLLGQATMQLTPYFYPQDILILDAKAMEIEEVSLLTANPESPVPLIYTYDNKKLSVSFDASLERSDTIVVRVKYKSGANADRQMPWLGKGVYFIDPLKTDSLKPTQLWTQGEPEETSYWMPTIDAPNERATHEVIITVEDQYQTLSNGSLKESKWLTPGYRTDHWVMNLPHAPYLYMLAVGDFSVTNDHFNSIPLSYWVEPAYAPYSRDIFGHTPEMMAYFSDLLRYPFPWEKYAQIAVRDFVTGAMENTTASIFMEDLQVDRRSLLDFRWDYIIAHELMHQWFGNLVTCKSWSHLPLNEGFADYAEYLWNAHKYGQDEADFHFINDFSLYLDESDEKKVPLIRYNYLDPEEMFDAHTYQKSARVIHMLRSYVGDDAFFEALHQYLKKYAFQSVALEHLRLVFEEVTGEDLKWFFDQWFYIPGHPLLQVSHEYKQDTIYVKIAQVQDLEESTIYQLPFYVDIYFGEDVVHYPVKMVSPKEEYRIYSREKPSLVLVDSEHQLLAEIAHQKSKDEYIFQFRNAARFPAKLEALEAIASFTPLDQKTVEVYQEALFDPYFRIRVMAIEFFTENLPHANEAISMGILDQVHDTISDVRVAALSFLGEKNYQKYSESVHASLNDSAYSVVGTGLALILANEPQFFGKFVSDFKAYEDINVLLPIAEFYGGKAQHQVWFLEKAMRLRTADLYYFLPYMNNHLLQVPLSEKRYFLPYLEKISKHHSNYMIRFLGIQGLLFLHELPEVADILKSIMASERDPRLITLIDSIITDQK